MTDEPRIVTERRGHVLLIGLNRPEKRNAADFAMLQQLAQSMDVGTCEFDNVPAETVAYLANYVPVYPNAESLRIARDRLNEKTLFRELGIPVTVFANVESQQQLEQAVAQNGLPAILKIRIMGYDGKGQKVLRTAEDVGGAHAELGGVPCLLESFVDFSGEVSVIAVRGRDGEICCYPLAHNTHRDGILELSVASDNHPLQALAEDYAGKAGVCRCAGLRVFRGGRRPDGQRDSTTGSQLRTLDHRRGRMQPV